MFQLQTGTQLEIRTPAKLNLFLETLARRTDGFHEIETLITPITIYDTLFITSETVAKIRLTCQWATGWQASSLGDLPIETDNLVLKAVKLLQQRADVELGASIHLVKRIPAAAGLGGASSDAAAALVAANVVWKLGWSQNQLTQLAAELGSDIPFFLGYGMAVCRGRGETIEPIGKLPKLHMVVVRPPAGLATAEVYQHCEVPDKPMRIDDLLVAIEHGRVTEIARQLFNRLQQPAANLSPWVKHLQQEFDRFDFLGHQMSGSGTSYFGVCRHARHARRVAARLQSRNIGAVFQASTIPG